MPSLGLSHYLFHDWTMAVTVTVAATVLFWVTLRVRNYVLAMCGVALAVEAVFYWLLALDIEPINSSQDLRLDLFRPSQFFFLVFLMAYLANGRVNAAIGEILRRVRPWIRRFSKTG